jgi:hypothetical protein
MRASKELSFRRKSIAYFRSEERMPKNDAWLSLYGNMFIQDVQLYVMPIGGESHARPDFAIELVPDNPTARSIITYAFARRDPSYRDMTEAISEFIAETAHSLAYKRVLYYEIARGDQPIEENSKTEDIENLTLSGEVFKPLHIPGRVMQLGNYYLQIIPRAEWTRTGRKIIVIPASDVWSLQIPSELGGPRKHRILLKTLVRASNPMPDFVSESTKRLSEIRDFSFGGFHKQQKLAVASESALWGWPVRNLLREDTLEYFRIYRHLRFALSMAILREYILASMNDLLQRLGFTFQLVLKGLPIQSEIKSYIVKMEKGEMTFDDAWKAVDI